MPDRLIRATAHANANPETKSGWRRVRFEDVAELSQMDTRLAADQNVVPLVSKAHFSNVLRNRDQR